MFTAEHGDKPLLAVALVLTVTVVVEVLRLAPEAASVRLPATEALTLKVAQPFTAAAEAGVITALADGVATSDSVPVYPVLIAVP